VKFLTASLCFGFGLSFAFMIAGCNQSDATFSSISMAAQKTVLDAALLEQIAAHQAPCPPEEGEDNSAKLCAQICHVPPGNPPVEHTLVLPSEAFPAHLDHGDYVGPCGGLQPPAEEPPAEEPPAEEPPAEEPPVDTTDPDLQ
jgi:hypothetical protein